MSASNSSVTHVALGLNLALGVEGEATSLVAVVGLAHHVVSGFEPRPWTKMILSRSSAECQRALLLGFHVLCAAAHGFDTFAYSYKSILRFRCLAWIIP